jgi:hypothetical protein
MNLPSTAYPTLFNQTPGSESVLKLIHCQTPDQLRRIGARGGRACARKRRAQQRLSLAGRRADRASGRVAGGETTARMRGSRGCGMPGSATGDAN